MQSKSTNRRHGIGAPLRALAILSALWAGDVLSAASKSPAPVAATTTAAAPAPAPTATQPANNPDAVVKHASDTIQQLLIDHRATYEADPEALHKKVDAGLAMVVDYDGIAKTVMGVAYRQATDAQRRRFADVFRTSLVRTYTRAMLMYVDFKISLLPTNAAQQQQQQQQPDRATVRMQAAGPSGKTYPMEYSVVRLANGDWRIRNVTVNGINLGSIYKTQFASELNSGPNAGNIDKVIDGWTPIAITSKKAADSVAAGADQDKAS